MAHTLTISDQAYEALLALARQRALTPEAFIEAWVAPKEQVSGEPIERNPYTDPRYQTFEEFFRELGMTDDEIEEAKAMADADDADV